MNEWRFLIQHGRIQDGYLHQVEWEWISLSQIELVWVKSQSGVRVFLSESERRKQGVWIQHGRIQDDCHHQVESEWLSEGFFVQMVGTNPGKCEWVMRGKTKMAESKMVKFTDGQIQDGCHHQVEWEWISLSQIKLVWVRVRVELECFWVNLREENKVSESNRAEFKMAAIIRLSQYEWVKFF